MLIAIIINNYYYITSFLCAGNTLSFSCMAEKYHCFLEIKKDVFSLFSSGNIVCYICNAWFVIDIWRNSEEIEVTGYASQNLAQKLGISGIEMSRFCNLQV